MCAGRRGAHVIGAVEQSLLSGQGGRRSRRAPARTAADLVCRIRRSVSGARGLPWQRYLLAGATLVLAESQWQRAEGVLVCTAAEIAAAEPACPASGGSCVIAGTYEIGDGCVLDFGTRPVTLAGDLVVGSRSMALLAGSFTVSPGGMIDGRGSGTSFPTNLGGSVSIAAAGDVAVKKSGSTNGRIDVSGRSAAGLIDIVAGGSVRIEGRVEAGPMPYAAGAAGGMEHRQHERVGPGRGRRKPVRRRWRD